MSAPSTPEKIDAVNAHLESGAWDRSGGGWLPNLNQYKGLDHNG
jgi:hypothetical protein